MIIIIGSNSGIAQKLIRYSFGKEKIIGLYNRKIPRIRKKNIIFKKMNLKNNNFIKLVNYVEKQNDKKLVIINFSSIKEDMLSIKISNKKFKQTFDVNLFGYFNFLKAFLPTMMKNKWGRVINISSTGGLRGDIGTSLYTSSKNASLGLFKVLSKEYSKFDITFNTISLGSFNTGMYQKLPIKLKDKIISNIPSGKNGSFRNIYNGIKFLQKSDYVNGSIIKIDGGM